MRFNVPLFLTFIFSQSITYGLVFEMDKRIDVYQIQLPAVKEIAKSVFTFIPKDKLTKNQDGFFEFNQLSTLKEFVNLCEGEPFSDQPSVATRCSGFLSSKSLGITAGHCVAPSLVSDFCKNYYIIFDYIHNDSNEYVKKLKPESVRECEQIQKLVFDPSGKNDDYAIIRFANEVTDRTPLKFRRHGKIQDKANIFMLGYPKGMAQKISPNGHVISNTGKSTFSTHLDCFRGNSGSPVFDVKTLLIEGIFIRGSGDIPNNSSDPNLTGDFFTNPQFKCNQTLICKKSEKCTATMHVMRTTRISFK